MSVYWVPTDLFGEQKSTGMAEQCLEGGFSDIFKNYKNFDARSETGGLYGASVPSELNKVAYNTAAAYYMAMTYGVHGRVETPKNHDLGTPTIVAGYQHSIPAIIVGIPQEKWLFSAVNAGGNVMTQ